MNRSKKIAFFSLPTLLFLALTASAQQGNGSLGTVDIPIRTLVDEHVFGKLNADGIPHAGLAGDEEFIRRVYIDAAGVLPSSDAVREFLADNDPAKRDKLIDSLIGTEEFTEQWAWFWGDLFRLAGQSGGGANAFQYWNKEWLRVDRPYNDVVYDLMTGVTKSHSTLPALAFLGRTHYAKSRIVHSEDDYSIMNRLDTLDQFNIDVGRVFLGINTDCISCHDGAGHIEEVDLYMSTKTRDDFYRHSAFLGGTRIITTWDDRAKNVGVNDMIVDDTAKGYDTDDDAPYWTLSESRVPRNGGAYTPAFILTGEEPRPGMNPRAELARMLTEHIQFGRATVNLIWGKLMTVPFVAPYDGFDLSRLDPDNPPPEPLTIQPTNPELLNALAEDFMANDYSIHHLMKTILKSSAYQLSSEWDGEPDGSHTSYYPRRFPRVLTGPEVIDAIGRATARPFQFAFGDTEVTRVKQLAMPSNVGGRRAGGEPAEVSAVMQSFYQSNRMTPPPTGNKASTLQALLLMSSKIIGDRATAENGSRVQQLVESDRTDAEVVEELYLSSFSRRPTLEEEEVALEELGRDRTRGAENLQWALLTSSEFILNH